MSESTAQSEASRPNGMMASPLALAFVCYGIWGIVPLAYIPLHKIGAEPFEIMAHRAVWAVLCCGILIFALKQGRELFDLLRQGKARFILLISALLMTVNWGLFIWAVENHALLESSLGYYINPLLNMAAGTILFRERLDRWGQAAIALAVLGVGIQTLAIGHIPYIALILALSFSTYGIIRKQLVVSALSGLMVECLYMFVPMLGYIIWLEQGHGGHLFHDPASFFWFAFTGPVTVVPLALFSYVARRLSLSTLGFIQFLSPTLSFVIGLAQGEAFSPLRALSFAVIWAGALVFAFGAWVRLRRMKSIPMEQEAS